MKTIHDYTITLNKALGYDFNTVEFAIRNGIPYAIDFCNPAPDADINSVGQANFDWIVEHAAKFAIEKALSHKLGQNNCSWGDFVSQSVAPPAKAKLNVTLKTAAEVKKTGTKKAVSAKTKKGSTSASSKKAATKPAAKKTVKGKKTLK
jgi:hypothetical protein